MALNTRVLLAKRPHGEPTDDCFEYVSGETPALEEDQVLIKVVWLSLDPYMRGRMNDMKSYVASLEIGDVMSGESTGIVVESKSDKYSVGDRVAAHMGWQTYIVADADDPRLIAARHSQTSQTADSER